MRLVFHRKEKMSMIGLFNVKRLALMITVIALNAVLLTVTYSQSADDPNARNPQTIPPQTPFNGALALGHVADQVAFGTRATGTAEAVLAGDAILAHFDALGWETSEDWETLTFPDLPIFVPARNLIASYGSGDTTIILGGHWDSRVIADQDPDVTLRASALPPGANDNGSGVGVLMELGRAIIENYDANAEIRIVLFDAEDNPGVPPWSPLMGSRAYVADLDLTTENIRYVVVVDMVGDDNQIIPIEANSQSAAPDVVAGLWGTAADLGYATEFGEEAEEFIVRYALQDDHISFIEAGIPAVVLIDFDYPYWHTTQDTLDKISPDSLQRVGDVILTFLERDGVITRR